MWERRITCERIVPASEATGAATVLGGEMRCPDEDGQLYQKDLLDLLACLLALCPPLQSGIRI